MRLRTVLAWIAVSVLAAQPVSASQGEHEGGNTLVMKLCDGGQVTIPLGNEDDDKGAPHCPGSKACHAANCRRQFDPAQRPVRQ